MCFDTKDRKNGDCNAPENVKIGPLFELDAANGMVYCFTDGERDYVRELQGMKFEILKELATAYFRSDKYQRVLCNDFKKDL